MENGIFKISASLMIFAAPYDTSDHLQDGYYHFNAERFFFHMESLDALDGSLKNGLSDGRFAEISSFKGLENEAVIVVDLEPPVSGGNSAALHYVAMSRPRAVLSLIFMRAIVGTPTGLGQR